MGIAAFVLTCLILAAPGTQPVHAVKVEQDAVYGIAEGYWTEAPDHVWKSSGRLFRRRDSRRSLELKMDIYLPADDSLAAARPLFLLLHGGSFFMGNKASRAHVEWCRYFASLGYVAASIDYRLGYPIEKPGFTRAEREAVEDAETALAYLLGRADLHIDREQVYLAGTSAGAATVLSLAYEGHVPDCRIRAVANLWGYLHRLDVLENACIPILSFQSEQDPIVPYREGYPGHMGWLADKAYGTLAIYEKASALGIPCEHHPCPEKRHRLQADSHGALTPRFYDIRDRMASFFAAIGREM